MKRGVIIIVWSGVILGSIILGVWQRQNLSIFWREYRGLWRDYDYKDGSLVQCKPLISEDAARSDPEAAAIANIKLQRYGYEEDEYLDTLVENTLKFPDNEYLLFATTGRILRCVELDQEIALRLAEKLINFDEDNSLYHYLKAVALLANKRGESIAPVLDEIETAANCPNIYFPETKYTKRVIAVAEKASLRPALIGESSNPYFDAPWADDISEIFLRYAHRAFTDGEVEKGLLIDDAINSIGENQLDAGHDEARFLMNRKDRYLSFVFGYWSCPEILELQRANINEQRAVQNRIQLCPYALKQIESEKRTGRADLNFYAKPEVTHEQMIFAVSIAMHNGRMLFVVGIVLSVLIVISMVRGRPDHQKVGITTFILFAATSLYYFIAMPLFYLIIYPGTCYCCCSYEHIMRPSPIDWKEVPEWPAIYWFVPLICPVLTALLLWLASRPRLSKASFWLKIPLRLIVAIVISGVASTLYFLLIHLSEESIDLPQYLHVFIVVSIFALPAALFASWLSKLRLVRALLVTTPLSVFTALASPYAYISQIPFFLFVVTCSLIVLNKPSFGKALIGIFFSKQPELAVLRGRAIKLLAPFIVVYWLLFVASVPTCAKYIEQLCSWSYSKSDLAPADETSYQQVLAKFDSNDFTLSEFWRLAPLVTPQDLSSILNNYKDIYISISSPYRFVKNPTECSDGNSTPEKDKLIKKFNDYYILTAMQGCGRDVINILTEAMENPERESALVSRAQLGDIRVKGKLEELLAWRLTDDELPEPNKHLYRWDKPAKIIDIICGLACISEPNEAGTMFLDYITRGDMSHLIEDHEFFRGIPLLPTTQAREVIKAYLAKAQEWQPPERVRFDGEKFREDLRRTLSPVRELAGTYADKDISEAVLKIMLRSEDEDVIKDWDGPWGAPQEFDMQSADLLRQGLASKNDSLRAWCVWQLKKVGYRFSEEEETGLLADESWKVRANAASAGGRKTARLFVNDQHPFVRFVASISAGEKNNLGN
ncbi:MAG: hypothetical protein JW947_04410 [Sedimentisphaerales bacterium]|nr:hypothetical protein [Sedimentisphaerales bacterium]